MPRAANSVVAYNAILLCVCMFFGAGPWLTINLCIFCYCVEMSIRDYRSSRSRRQALAPFVNNDAMQIQIAILLCVCRYYLVEVRFVISLCMLSLVVFIDDNVTVRENKEPTTPRPLQLHPVDGPLPDEFCVVCQDTGTTEDEWVTIQGCNRHRFHRQCVAQFQGNTCMLCRTPLYE